MEKRAENIIRINLWSGPRNISTALMYSFAQRGDTRVIDEPLYAHYLSVSGVDHPGRNEVLSSMENDGMKVIKAITWGECDRNILFCKQMTHHLVELPYNFILQTKNILLIRNPLDVLISYSKVIDKPKLIDIGIKQTFDLWNYLEKNNGHHTVVDADELLKDPESMLRKVCQQSAIDFQIEMLHWKAGARPEDGVWAKYWYNNVHHSTGFQPFEKGVQELPQHLKGVYEEAKPFYDLLLEKSLRS